MVYIMFESIYNKYKCTFTFLIVLNITDSVPNQTIPRDRFQIRKNILLSDLNFHVPAFIDMPTGAGETL